MSCSRSVSSSLSKKSIEPLTESLATCAMLRSATVTASDSGFSRIPSQAGHGLSDMKRSSSALRYSD